MKRVVLLLILLSGVAISQYRYDMKKNYFARQEAYLTLLSSTTLKIVSFGNKNLAADFLYLWAIQYYSSTTIYKKDKYIEQIFNLITDLNPTYYDPYIVGSWIMALEYGDIEMGMRLLKKGVTNLPQEWRFDHELAFYAYKDLKDYKLAEKFFRQAEKKGNSPSFLRRRQAYMVYLQGRFTEAFRLWLEIYNTSKDNMDRNVAFRHLYQIKFESDYPFLKKQINRFKENKKRYPRSLEELVQARYVTKVPKDFSNFDYIYDSSTGDIKTRRYVKWKQGL